MIQNKQRIQLQIHYQILIIFTKEDQIHLLQEFFDAKVDEITDIFSAGPSVKISDLVSVLIKVAPIYSSNWKKIKF